MTPSRRAVLASLAAVGTGCLGRSGPSQRSPAVAGTGVDADLGFTGDVMLGRGVDDRWTDGPPGGVWGGLASRLRSLDGLFVNLECCLSDRGRPRPGRTFHFRAGPGWAIPALRSVGVTWACLANNHVLDFGVPAFTDTLAQLSTAEIAHSGAGRALDSALSPSVVGAGGLTVAALGLTDRSPGYAASTDRPGTAFVRTDVTDPRTRWAVDTSLRRATAVDPDLVIVSLHWGPNWTTEPSGAQRRFARWLIDRGVDVVHGHSAHVVQGVEVYRGRPIIYDAGDFIDDYAVRPGLHNDRSFLFELVVEGGRLAGLRLVPIVIDDASVEPAGTRAAGWLRETMRKRSAAFGTPVERSGDGLWIALDDASG